MSHGRVKFEVQQKTCKGLGKHMLWLSFQEVAFGISLEGDVRKSASAGALPRDAALVLLEMWTRT